MMPAHTDVVCLCDTYDLKRLFGAHFDRDAPWIRLKTPEEIDDPGTIRHAIAFAPTPGMLRQFPSLALISSVGAGVDGLLSDPALDPGVAVSRLHSGEQAQMMAGFAIWHIVGWQRGLHRLVEQQEAQRWDQSNLTSPKDFPVGVLGMGKIGGLLARSLHQLGFPVTAYAGRARVTDDGIRVLSGEGGLAEIRSTSRAIVNLLPLTDITRGLLNFSFFTAMRADAILINLGRGGHLVESDLIAALDSGCPGHAALDVFQTEPLPGDHPFWAHPEVTVTAHIAGEPDPAGIARYLAKGIAAFEAGQSPAGLVDRARGY